MNKILFRLVLAALLLDLDVLHVPADLYIPHDLHVVLDPVVLSDLDPVVGQQMADTTGLIRENTVTPRANINLKEKYINNIFIICC